MNEQKYPPYKLIESVKITKGIKDLDLETKILWSGCIHSVEKDSMIRSFLKWLKDKQKKNSKL